MKIGELNKLYEESETSHRRLFAEQRSNIKLVAGDHYSKRSESFLKNLRGNDKVSNRQKLRLTKNHINKITKSLKNAILVHAPSVTVTPQNETEVQDRKAAELNQSVWAAIKHKMGYSKRVREFLDDYVDIGELIVELAWDEHEGEILGQQQMVDEFGQPEFTELGEPVVEEVKSGMLKWNRILGFNMLTDPAARSFDEARWVCVRKMSEIKPLVKKYADDEDKTKYIKESSKTTYKIFDNNSGEYSDSKGMCMIRTYYFRPNYEYPTGHYYITTEFGILEEGPIPLGDKVFPVKKIGYDDLVTSARSQSAIKQLRPYQAEINRAASKMAEHQISLGDDKIITQNGQTLSAGATSHGIKHIKISGPPPTILAGRSGEQYLGYIQSNISEMYSISGIQEESQEKISNQTDPWALMHRSASQKKRFVIYSTKFEEFLVDLCESSLRYKKAFMRDEELIPVIGRSEIVNIPEFRDTTDLNYQITIEPQSEDIETRMGKQMALTNAIQYAGSQLDKSDVGNILSAMPYLNGAKLTGELTVDHDNAENDILALDRGEYPTAERYENHKYLIRKLVNRMKQPDFKFLDPQVQQNYERKKMEHTQLDAQLEAEKLRATSGFIPEGGYFVSCDFYVQSPSDPTKQKRLRVPSDALDWLVKKLQEQSATQSQLLFMGDDASTQLMGQAQQIASNPPSQGGSPMPSQV